MARVSFDGVGKTYPDGTRAVLPVDLEAADGQLMVLIGPSGCGKTTMLRMVAGLEEITEGEIRIDGTVVNNLVPRKRDVAMVFQNYALYPHMTVFENLAFPLGGGGLSRREIRERVQRFAVMLGMEDLLRRRPRTLSGGQRQRVAIGRALVREPKVFLMDEPLSNLDAKLRGQMRSEIRKLQREVGVTTIYVTHDQVEAMTMGTQIAVMRRGVLQQQGAPQTLYDNPANLFVATFLGSPPMNLLRAQIERRTDGGVDCMIGETRLTMTESDVAGCPKLAGYAGRAVAVGIRPEDLELPVGESTAPRLRGRVSLVETLGRLSVVHAEVDADPVVTDEVLEIAEDVDAAAVDVIQAESAQHRVDLTAMLEARSRVVEGSSVEFAVDLGRIYFFDLDSGEAVTREADRGESSPPRDLTDAPDGAVSYQKESVE